MIIEFDGTVQAGPFADVTTIRLGCNMVDAEWLYK